MSKITKTLAAEIAVKLTAHLKEQEKSIKKEIGEILEKEMVKEVPKAILDLYETLPGYFQTKTRFRLFGNGFNGEYFNVNNPIPNRDDYYKSYTLSPKVSSKIIALNNNLDKLGQKRGELIQNIETTLYKLRTYKKVSEQFPEALPFLPKVKQEIALDINRLRSQLKEADLGDEDFLVCAMHVLR